MEWTKPTFVEIEMNAEIGGYQGDPGDPYEDVPVVSDRGPRPEPPREASRSR